MLTCSRLAFKCFVVFAGVLAVSTLTRLLSTSPSASSPAARGDLFYDARYNEDPFVPSAELSVSQDVLKRMASNYEREERATCGTSRGLYTLFCIEMQINVSYWRNARHTLDADQRRFNDDAIARHSTNWRGRHGRITRTHLDASWNAYLNTRGYGYTLSALVRAAIINRTLYVYRPDAAAADPLGSPRTILWLLAILELLEVDGELPNMEFLLQDSDHPMCHFLSWFEAGRPMVGRAFPVLSAARPKHVAGRADCGDWIVPIWANVGERYRRFYDAVLYSEQQIPWSRRSPSLHYRGQFSHEPWRYFLPALRDANASFVDVQETGRYGDVNGTSVAELCRYRHLLQTNGFGRWSLRFLFLFLCRSAVIAAVDEQEFVEYWHHLVEANGIDYVRVQPDPTEVVRALNSLLASPRAAEAMANRAFSKVARYVCPACTHHYLAATLRAYASVSDVVPVVNASFVRAHVDRVTGKVSWTSSAV